MLPIVAMLTITSLIIYSVSIGIITGISGLLFGPKGFIIGGLYSGFLYFLISYCKECIVIINFH